MASNRDASNLLLLCLFHAWEIDAIPEMYPAEMLRLWKVDQLALYDVARERRKSWAITDAEAAEAVSPFDVAAALDKLTAVIPFNPRMRSRVEAWQLAARRGHGRRVARLTPLVPAERRDTVLAWLSLNAQPVVEVPAGQVRVLVAGMSERASRWWEEDLQQALNDEVARAAVART
jgi:hypothetical protein